jgi:hypothetical protein
MMNMMPAGESLANAADVSDALFVSATWRTSSA